MTDHAPLHSGPLHLNRSPTRLASRAALLARMLKALKDSGTHLGVLLKKVEIKKVVGE